MGKPSGALPAELLIRSQNCGRLVETLPLTSEEFSLSCNRLRNAERYLQAAERGAARWELELLRRLLQRWMEERPDPHLFGRTRSVAA